MTPVKIIKYNILLYYHITINKTNAYVKKYKFFKIFIYQIGEYMEISNIQIRSSGVYPEITNGTNDMRDIKGFVIVT